MQYFKKGALQLIQNQQHIDVNQLNQVKANVTLSQNLLIQAIEKSSTDPTLAEEAIKRTVDEITQAQSGLNQVQSAFYNVEI